MKTTMWTMVVVFVTLGLRTSMAQSGTPRLFAEFSGASLKWVHTAEPEFQRRHLDLDRYVVVVAEQDDSVVVALTSTDVDKGAMGTKGSFPGYEVEISKKDMRIVRSNYVR